MSKQEEETPRLTMTFCQTSAKKLDFRRRRNGLRTSTGCIPYLFNPVSSNQGIGLLSCLQRMELRPAPSFIPFIHNPPTSSSTIGRVIQSRIACHKQE